MLLFVDYEHADWYASGKGRRNQAARTWITYRLEDLSGLPCILVRYNRVTEALVERLGVQAIFISGNATDPSRYRTEDTATLARIVSGSDLPVFGFCGGWQFLAEALGARLAPIVVAAEHAELAIVADAPEGWTAEVGYHPVRIEGSHAVLDGLGDAPVFRHAHGLHVPDVPSGFDVLASTEITPVQLAVDDSRRIVGAQFHPEYWTDDHPDGRTLIENFLRWIDLLP